MENSIWTKEVQLPSFPEVTKDLNTEVLIIGGGMAGLLCAFRLQQAGVEYVLLEADRICKGVTRNTTAKITSQHGLIYDHLLRSFDENRARLYWQCQQEALEDYSKLAREIDCDFQRADSYLYSVHTPGSLEREWRALRRLQIPADYLPNVPLPLSNAGAIRFRNQAQFHPLKFAAQIARGLHIYEHSPVRSFEGTVVKCRGGSIRAKKIIVATHFPIWNKHGSYFLKLYQERSYVLALEGARPVDGMYLDEAKGGFSFRMHGSTLLLGGSGHRTGKKGCAWSALEEFAEEQYPEAIISARWATQDCMSLDAVPYIGQYSKATPNLFVATGFNKWGMSNSMAAAGILCDLIQGKDNPYTELFSPSRSMLRKQLALNGVEACKHLLTLSRPRCPHMGCALKWNPREHSWDCPCHGSRFSQSGELLDNPATGNMRNKRAAK